MLRRVLLAGNKVKECAPMIKPDVITSSPINSLVSIQRRLLSGSTIVPRSSSEHKETLELKCIMRSPGRKPTMDFKNLIKENDQLAPHPRSSYGVLSSRVKFIDNSAERYIVLDKEDEKNLVQNISYKP